MSQRPYRPRPGERFRAEIVCKGGSYGADTGDTYEIQWETAEPLSRDKTPGQVAYDAFWADPQYGVTQVHLSWDFLSPSVRAQWERVARAAKEA